MSKKVNDILIKFLENISLIESYKVKIDSAVYIKNTQNILYKYNEQFSKNIENEVKRYKVEGYGLDKIGFLKKNYKEKTEKIYNEYYYRYVSILNYLLTLKKEQKLAIANYQISLNNKSNNIDKSTYKKYVHDREVLLYKLNLANNKEERDKINKELEDLNLSVGDITSIGKKYKKKFEVCEETIKKCDLELEKCKLDFEKDMASIFGFSNAIQVVQKNNIFQKIKFKILNLFNGVKNFDNVLNIYINKVDKIDIEKNINHIKEKTIYLLTDMIEYKES